MDNIDSDMGELDVAASKAESLIGYVPPKTSLCANVKKAAGGRNSNCASDSKLSCSRCHLISLNYSAPYTSSDTDQFK